MDTFVHPKRMNIHIEKAGTGLNVRIEVAADRGHLVLEKIRSCRQSAWACPSGECMRIATLEEYPGEGCVCLNLTPRAGEELSAAGIAQCLNYMLAEFSA